MASFSVVTNLASVNAQSNLYQTNIGLKTALTRVSSGFRINNSGDDAAGLAVANKFRSEVTVLTQGVRNANDGLSDLQIKDSALDNISKLLDRLSTLATQSASGQTTAASRTTLNQEFMDVLSEITREATVANLTASAGFSVFVSNNGSNGVVSRHGWCGDVDGARHQRADDQRAGVARRPRCRRWPRPSRRSAACRARSVSWKTVCPTPSTWRSRRL